MTAKALKVYLIYTPDGHRYAPWKRGNCTYVRSHAALAKCPKGYEVREYTLGEAGYSVVIAP